MMASEKPSGAVPRSSAMTRQRGAVAFEAQHREHRVERIIDIGALGGRKAARDQEQALELEGMVDPDRAGVAHVGRDQRAERREPLLLEGERIERRQAPVLPGRPERVRRRSDRKAGREALRVGPDLRAARIGADREVAVEADAHSGRTGPLRRLAELEVRQPLQPGVERHPLGHAPARTRAPRRDRAFR